MNPVPSPQLQVVRRGKPNFEDPGGNSEGDRKFQFFKPGGLDPSGDYASIHGGYWEGNMGGYVVATHAYRK